MSHHDANRLDRQAYRETPIHSLDPRAKTLATLIFIITVVSFPKYEISALVPFFIFPIFMIILGEVPFSLIAKRTLMVAPFAVMIGLFNPLMDRVPVIYLGGIGIWGGWVSFLSIILRFFLSVSAALALISTTSFPNLCRGLTRMKVPSALVTQLLFLYRYLFILVEEGLRIRRARDLRSAGRSGKSWRLAASIIGILFIRTMDRAERIYQAMVARGFRGEIRMIQKLSFKGRDLAFLAAVSAVCFFLRVFPLANWMGNLVRSGI